MMELWLFNPSVYNSMVDFPCLSSGHMLGKVNYFSEILNRGSNVSFKSSLKEQLMWFTQIVCGWITLS